MWIKAILVLFMLTMSEQKSVLQRDSYMAAVVEYEHREENLQNYVHLIEEAAVKNADIVIFPEMTLTKELQVVEVPIKSLLKEHPIPALHPDLFDEILVTLSNASRQHKIYVVVNVQEIMDCRNAIGEYCPEKKIYYFNTNVVFDRNGAVIDRYRKINLYGEFTRSPALQPDLGIFTTDFGVTFGHFICFDILFQVPAVQIVQKYNLTDIIFTSMWFSQLPYLSATQIQEAYAYSMDVNFLASGANNVKIGSAGTGIYSGKAGALISIMPGVPTTRLLVAKVPKTPGQVVDIYPGHIPDDPQVPDQLFFKRDMSLASQISLPLLQGYQEVTLTDRNVTCKFQVDIRQKSDNMIPRYRAFIQDNSNRYFTRRARVASCGIVACGGDDPETCPLRLKKSEKNVEFKQLKIEMVTYESDYNSKLGCENIVYYPVSFTTDKFPLQAKDYTYIESKNKDSSDIVSGSTRITYSINGPQSGIISFGIWGRIFNEDTDEIQFKSLKH